MSTVAQTNVATSTKVVQVRGVSKVFKRDAFQVTALDDVSIDIGKGEFLALMGPSGSGKTTLLNMIAAIDRPTSGELLVQGQDIFRFSDSQIAHWRNEHIGYVFQTFNLIPVLSAFENVELPLLLTKLNAQQRREHVLTALKLVVRRAGTASGHRARDCERSDAPAGGRAYWRFGQPFGD
jgi:putative ABC transport system ATP-binding protein